MYQGATIVLLGTLVLAWADLAACQQASTSSDPFQQYAMGIQLDDQNIVDGIAMLVQGTGLAVSVEYQLGDRFSEPAPKMKTFSVRIGLGTILEEVNRLCALDPTFTWVRRQNMINVLPRAALRNPSYFLNRKIDHLVLKDVQNPSQVVVDMVGQLSGPREQIAVLAVGQPLDFATPWTANLENVTVRDVFDFIAKQLGPAYGWQFSGALDFRVITFHAGLLPEAGRTKRQ